MAPPFSSDLQLRCSRSVASLRASSITMTLVHYKTTLVSRSFVALWRCRHAKPGTVAKLLLLPLRVQETPRACIEVSRTNEDDRSSFSQRNTRYLISLSSALLGTFSLCLMATQ